MCWGEEEWNTECMCLNEWEIVVRVKMQGAEAVTADAFKYLGSTIQSNWQPHKRGGERRIAAKENITVYNLVRRVLDVWFGDVALTEIWEAHLEVAELKFLRILLEVIRLERIGNEWTSDSSIWAVWRTKRGKAEMVWREEHKRSTSAQEAWWI